MENFMDALNPDKCDPWDICLKYLLVKHEDGEQKARLSVRMPGIAAADDRTCRNLLRDLRRR
jgi:hypothetical protein